MFDINKIILCICIRLAVFCLMLLYLPALIALVFTLASPLPTLQPEGASFKVKIQKSDLKWIFTQIVNAIFFPIAAISRYVFFFYSFNFRLFTARNSNPLYNFVIMNLRLSLKMAFLSLIIERKQVSYIV